MTAVLTLNSSLHSLCKYHFSFFLSFFSNCRDLSSCAMGISASFWFKYTRATLKRLNNKNPNCGIFYRILSTTAGSNDDLGFHILLKSCDARAFHIRLKSQSLWYDHSLRMDNTPTLYRKWIHIAFTWDKDVTNHLSVFINGQKEKEFTVSIFRFCESWSCFKLRWLADTWYQSLVSSV